MKKSRIEKLIPIANQALLDQYDEMLVKHNQETDSKKKKEILDDAILRKKVSEQHFHIKSNYDGKVSGFGITVALSGLRLALSMYFNESGDVKTRPILEAIAKIIVDDGEYNNEIRVLNNGLTLNETTERSLVALAIQSEMNPYLPILKRYVLEATTALKQVVRTYELV